MEGHWRVGQVSQQSHILLVWTFFSQIIITTPPTSNKGLGLRPPGRPWLDSGTSASNSYVGNAGKLSTEARYRRHPREGERCQKKGLIRR